MGVIHAIITCIIHTNIQKLRLHKFHLFEVLHLKVTTKGRYGLTMMIDLAKQYANGPVSIKTIAKDNNLSINYLEQLAVSLRNAGLIKSIRGAYGGYRLTKHPKQITAGDIIQALEGPIMFVEGIEDDKTAQQMLWLQVTKAIKDVLETTTLADLMQYDVKQQNQYMFYI